MLEIIRQISPQNQQLIRQHLAETVAPHLRPDPSNYAKGRLSCWLDAEWLLNKKSLVAAHPMPVRLRTYLKRLNIPFDLALVTYGPVGIDWHRDDSYAAFPAYSINLSTVDYEWGYQAQYPGFEKSHDRNDNAPRVTHLIPPGAIIKFNCKNPHAALGRDDDRWSINLWTLKPKYQAQFDELIPF